MNNPVKIHTALSTGTGPTSTTIGKHGPTTGHPSNIENNNRLSHGLNKAKPRDGTSTLFQKGKLRSI
jgi:hypothetical protein